MSENYKHLTIERENLRNDRRTSSRIPPSIKRDNLSAHGKKLALELSQALSRAKKQVSSQEGDFVLKLKYSGSLSFKNLEKSMKTIFLESTIFF